MLPYGVENSKKKAVFSKKKKEGRTKHRNLECEQSGHSIKMPVLMNLQL